jgi:hypothetical protein
LFFVRARAKLTDFHKTLQENRRNEGRPVVFSTFLHPHSNNNMAEAQNFEVEWL